LPKLQLEQLKASGKGDEFCEAVAATHSELTKVDLSGSKALTVKGMVALLNSCPQLRKLNVVGSEEVDDAALATLIKQYPRLNPNTVVSRNKGDLFCAAIAEGRPNLIAINLSNCKVTLDGVLTLAGGCSRLKKLDISLCSEVQAGINTSLGDVGKTCRYLASINFAGCVEAVTDKSIKRIAEACPRLSNVCLASCTNLSSESIIKFVAKCKKLKALELRGCVDAVTDTVIGAIGKHRRLLKLNVAQCTRLTKACTALMPPQLTHLTLAGCENIDPSSLGSCCKDLISLNISACKSVKDASIIELSKTCEKLEELLLAGCDKVTDEGVTALTNCSKLTRLSLAGCLSVTDLGVATVAKGNKLLRELILALCFTLTDAAITAVQKHCRVLKILDITLCRQLTDEAVSALAASNTDLSASDLLWSKSLEKEEFMDLMATKKVGAFKEADIRYPHRFVANEAGTSFSGKTSQWCPFVQQVPLPKTGVHTARVRFDKVQSAMVGFTTERDPLKTGSFAGTNKTGISLYSNAGEIYYGGRSYRGTTRSFRPTREDSPGFVTATYNAQTKQVSWKSNETEWLNSHVFENDSDVYFTISVTGTYNQSAFEVLETSWILSDELSGSFENLADQVLYMDLQDLLEKTP